MSAESLIIIFLALAAGSFVKGISGLGLPLTAIPVMAVFLSLFRARVFWLYLGLCLSGSIIVAVTAQLILS